MSDMETELADVDVEGTVISAARLKKILGTETHGTRSYAAVSQAREVDRDGQGQRGNEARDWRSFQI
jgi:hypothetical protein